VTRTIIESARNHDAVATFEALYRLAELKRETESAWRDFDVMVVPTMPRPYTVAEVNADPIALNSNLGTYTNFVNLLDLAAFAVPSGVRTDGLPSSVTLIGPAGSDGALAGLAQAIQARSGAPVGASGEVAKAVAPSSRRAKDGRIEIAVVGAHLSGLPLNKELTTLGGAFLRKAETTASYRLYALNGTSPPKPGLLRVDAAKGRSIAAEIWSLDIASFGAFVANIPAPLGVGVIDFADGVSAKGFLVEAEAVKGAKDVSEFGGWRAYMESLS
jgi:allophanate hydrolase